MELILPLENKRLKDLALEEAVASILLEKEQFLFNIVTDLHMDGKYGDAFVCFTDKRIITADRDSENNVKTCALYYDEVERLFTKRMYGNAVLNAVKKDGEKIPLIKSTYAITAFFNVGIVFFNKIAAGISWEEAIEPVGNTYKTYTTTCPKCGRTLVHPGAECLNCASKGRMVSKLKKYITPELKPLVIAIVLSIITTACSLVTPYATKSLVDDIIPNKELQSLYIVVALLLGTYLCQYLFTAIRSTLLRYSGDRIVESLRNDVFEKAQHLPMRFYDKTSTGSVINRISNDTSTLQSFIMRITQEVVTQLFLLVGIVIIMLSMNWKLTLLALIPVPFVVMASRKFGRLVRPFYRRIWRKWTAVSSVLTDSIPCIKVVKSFSGEKRAAKRFQDKNQEWYKVSVRAGKMASIFPNLISFVVVCGSLLIWYVGGINVIDNKAGISLGLLVSFISYTSMFYGPVNFFAGLNDSYQNAITSAERIMDILDAEPEKDDGKGNTLDEIKGKVEFKHVTFSFDKTKNVLSDIDFTIEPGECVGIVGTTGSGKTTLINLFLRFYDNYDGQILLDGRDIKDIDMEYFRSHIGYVQQEAMMFSDTIFNNIAYGKPDASVEEVLRAADVANAHEFILRHPDAYDTILGERGVGLSGGERQRISIARAILNDPSVLIFDEATSAVDSETEKLIQDAINKLIKGRTTLMIAHRLSTLRQADKIMVIDQGKILEFGTPQELMALKGKYYKLVNIQSMADQVKLEKEKECLE